jgi:hypothetical protein
VEAVAGLQVGDVGALGGCRAGHRPSQYGRRRRHALAVVRAIPRSKGPFSGRTRLLQIVTFSTGTTNSDG